MRAIHIVISGAGMVGMFLARQLAEEHSVVVIEKDAARCVRLAETSKAMVINGDACDYRYQDEARVGTADVFAAVTGDDDDNLVACQLARVSFDVPRTVARVNNPKNERIFKLMGIDAISSTTVIGTLIREESTVGDIITLNIVKKGKIAIVEVDIPDGGCKACDADIKDLGLPPGCVIVSLVRGEEVIVPRGPDRIMAGDTIIAVTSIDKEESLKRILLKGG